MSNPETTVTDIEEQTKHCRLVGSSMSVYAILTSSDDINDIKAPGLYCREASNLPANWPASYGILTVQKAHGGSIYQTIIDNNGDFYIRSYSTALGWRAWNNYANAVDVRNALAPARGIGIDSSNYSKYLTNANTAPAGRSYFIVSNITSQMISNLPAYGINGYLVTLNTIKDNEHGRIQIFGQKNGPLWYRTETGTGSTYNYSAWSKLAVDSDIASAVANVNARITEIETGYMFVPSEIVIGGLNTSGEIDTSATKRATFSGYIQTAFPCGIEFDAGYAGTICTYDANHVLLTRVNVSGNGKDNYTTVPANTLFRVSIRNNPEVTLSDADLPVIARHCRLLDGNIQAAITVNPLAAKIFKRVGCIGDSYTEGYIKYGSGDAQHLPAYAWPHYMESLTGNVWTNFGVSGSSSKSWMQGGTYSKLSAVQAAGNKCQAYVIGLMLNDSTTSSPNYVAVGTSADIGTDADSYYAYYYKLIAAVHAVNANAPIFCNTCPQTASRLTPYNQAVRDIVAYCKQHSMPVYLCDLAGERYFTRQYYANPIFTTDSLNSHYSTIGYEMMAECYLRVLSDVVVENVTDFQDVHLIDFDEPSN